jgi:hypothetical protein
VLYFPFRAWTPVSPSGFQATPTAIRALSSGAKNAENHILRWYLLQRLTDHRHTKSRRYKSQRASGAVRFLDNSRLETHHLIIGVTIALPDRTLAF